MNYLLLEDIFFWGDESLSLQVFLSIELEFFLTVSLDISSRRSDDADIEILCIFYQISVLISILFLSK